MSEQREDRRGDHQCFRAIAAGSADALEKLYQQYRQPVRDFLASREQDDTVLEDMTQEVFVRVWKQASRFRGESAAKTYLFGIAANVLRERVARHARDIRGQARLARPAPATVTPTCDGLSGPEAAAYLNELQEKLVSNLAGLPQSHRRAVELAIFKGLSTQEAAAQEGCSVDVFRKRLYRAIRALRTSFDGLPPAASGPRS